ncbi:hypothetical protein R3W88_007439 [Solanum pinnatisectum]|uniref:Inosine/uridine-preferring nucleoside hydrolase domain-containing protein n=1 Tax=Solanum pinnatisectum TaxID=50273 RepID=A0AAV9M530_9SOLN|nr:hypothetical protein R3W88_007439 [Solanum pinnatisectum]
MTILMAFQTPEVEIIGLATIFGNCEAAGYPDVPVVEDSSEPLKVILFLFLPYIPSNSYNFFSLQSHILCIPKRQRGEPRVADFVHGSVGLGNLFLPSPNSKKKKSTSLHLNSWWKKFLNILVKCCQEGLNLCKQGGESGCTWCSFFALGNVNPVAEANVGDFFPNGIYGDPEAADVFTSGANIDVVGISITTQVKLKDADLEELKQSEGKHAKFVCDMCKFYRDWHVKSDGVYGNICVLILFLDDRQCFLNHFLAYIL